MQSDRSQARYLRMSTWPIPKLILTMSVPSIISMLISSLYSMADTYFVGQMPALSMESAAAVTLISPMLIIIQGIGLAFGVGASSFISRLMGQRDMDKANQVLATSLYTSFLIGLAMMGLCYLFLDPIIRLLGATPALMELSREYGSILLLGAPILAASFVLNNALRAEGSVTFSTIGITVGAILNIILDPIFILTLGMGIRGAAIATVLSQLVSLVILLSFYLRGKSMLSISPKHFTPKGWVYGNVLKIGIPTFIRNVLGALSSSMVNNAAVAYGEAALAAMGIIGRVSWLVFSVLLGFSQAYMPVAGFNYGARRYSRVREAYTFSRLVGIAFMAVSAIAMYAFAVPLTRLLNADPNVAPLAASVLRAQVLTYPLIAFGVMTNMLYEALGRAVPAAVLSLGRQGLFLMAAILILPPIFGFDGVIWSQPAADMLFFALALPMSLRIMKQLKHTEDSPDPLPVEGDIPSD